MDTLLTCCSFKQWHQIALEIKFVHCWRAPAPMGLFPESRLYSEDRVGDEKFREEWKGKSRLLRWKSIRCHSMKWKIGISTGKGRVKEEWSLYFLPIARRQYKNKRGWNNVPGGTWQLDRGKAESFGTAVCFAGKKPWRFLHGSC